MLKKVFAGGLLLVAVGALVVGLGSLWNRSEDAHAGQGLGRQDRNVIAQGGALEQAASGRGQGQGWGNREAGANPRADQTIPSGGYSRGQGRNNPQRSDADPGAQVAAWQTVEGTVIETTELVIETADGHTMQVGLGPSHYRESQGFALQVGDKVRVSGYFEGDEFKAGQVEKVDTGESIVLRDTYGRPMWAGQGRRNG
jgi:hypothetical protein